MSSDPTARSLTAISTPCTARRADGKTVCTAPTFYSDGELLEGMEIMIVLDADTSLWNSGAQQEFDYAVIYTDPEIYLQTSHSFDEIACSLPASSVGEFVYTLKEIISR